MTDEIFQLVQKLDISAEHAEEIIDIYFEFFSDLCTYTEFLYKQIRVIRNTKENQMMIAELKTIDDICLYEGDDYVLITNYDSLVKYGDIEDCLQNPF